MDGKRRPAARPGGQAPGDSQRAFVATQDGTIQVFDFSSGATTASLFLDIRDLTTLLGKILRINADGSVPADNPYVGMAGSDEIWAYGLRNPFRASFDRGSDELIAGDVGQGQREEIDLITRGGNYGWRKFEGTLVYNASDPDPGNAIAPLFEYAHTNGRCSIIGGYVYRGTALVGYDGAYFYADYCSGELWALTRTGGIVNTLVGTFPGNPTSFGEDLDGELYVTSFDGKVYKIVPGSLLTAGPLRRA